MEDEEPYDAEVICCCVCVCVCVCVGGPEGGAAGLCAPGNVTDGCTDHCWAEERHFSRKTDRERSSADGLGAPVNGDRAGIEASTHIESDFLFLPQQDGFTRGRPTRARSSRITGGASLKHHPRSATRPTAPMRTTASLSPPP